MVKHIVLFKLKSTLPAEEKQRLMHDFKTALEALTTKIDCLRSIEVGLNANPAEAFDIALTTTFDTPDDLNRYATHPDHVAAAGIIAQAKESRACVDYIYE